MDKQGRRMPTKKAIKDHWASQLVEMGKFDLFPRFMRQIIALRADS